MPVVGILQDGELSPAGVSFRQEKFFRKGQEGAFDGHMLFFQMHLVREGKIKVIGPHFIVDKIYPMMIAAFFYQEEEIIIFPVREVEMGAVTEAAVYLFDLEQVIPIFTGLAQGIMRDDLFWSGSVQKNGLRDKGKMNIWSKKRGAV